MSGYVGTADERQKAADLLERLPPWPAIYWHGANGKPCPCATCCTKALRLMEAIAAKELLKATEKAKARRERRQRRRTKA